MAGSADLPTGPRHALAGSAKLELWNHGKKLFDCHLHLHPGEVRARTPVNAAAEGDMPISRVDDDLFGVFKRLRIPVGRGE
ncbi:MAG: hypothetical protein R2706_08265 [Acidimicrobiales bacterium]